MIISTHKDGKAQRGGSLIQGCLLQSPCMGQQCHLILTPSSSHQGP